MEDLGVSKLELVWKLGKLRVNIMVMFDGDRNMIFCMLVFICFELGVDVDVKIGNGVFVRY